HEFGHYHGGDTALGPWIYRTRAAIERTLIGMSRHSTAIMKPFEWYMKMFVRVTHAISRRQEFVADALAARAVGVQHMASGLRTVHAAGAAYEPFWFGEYVPAVESGFRPPLAEGFRRFLAAPSIAAVVEEGLARELREEKADPYDTHPPLRERLAALRDITPTGPTTHSEPALTLLDGVPAMEEKLLAAMVSGPKGAPVTLRPVAWDRMLDEVWASAWKTLVRQEGKRLDGLTVAKVAEFAGDPLRFTACCGFSAGAQEQQQRMLTLLGAALSLALLDRGLPASAEPGSPVIFTAGELAIQPFAILSQLAEGGPITPAQWTELAASLGIADLPLSTVAGDPQPVAA
ncbi:MAG TPA: M48 family metalloprotease, partial [Longimicrobiaceae bacterium]|nr:M48 family metalloprotease [Longimicrobiaceae bacterium]